MACARSPHLIFPMLAVAQAITTSGTHATLKVEVLGALCSIAAIIQSSRCIIARSVWVVDTFLTVVYRLPKFALTCWQTYPSQASSSVVHYQHQHQHQRHAAIRSWPMATDGLRLTTQKFITHMIATGLLRIQMPALNREIAAPEQT